MDNAQNLQPEIKPNSMTSFLSKNKNLFIYGITGIIVIIAVILALYLTNPKKENNNDNNSPEPTVTITPTIQESQISWSFNGAVWGSNFPAPECADPITFDSPADLNLATNILYPGQTRGGDYKPHGGITFTGKKPTDITVKLPMDAKVYRAVRYLEDGDVQYMIDFVNQCGILFRFDHLLTLSPKYQAILDTTPQATADSRTTLINPQVDASKGETIATAVGHPKGNIGFDLGVYDLRKQNEIARDEVWARNHADEKELGFYGLCWLNNLSSNDSTKAKSLPGGGTEGKVSDYCK